MAKTRGGKSPGGRGGRSDQSGAAAGGRGRGGKTKAAGGRGSFSAVPPPPGLYSGGGSAGGSGAGRGGGSRGGGAPPMGSSPSPGGGGGGFLGGGGGTPNQRGGLGYPGRGSGGGGGSGRGAQYSGRGDGGRGGARGGYGGVYHPGGAARHATPHIGGLANQFVHVGHEPRERLWKVSVPHGQRFSKQFLAGIEVWALQMLAHGQVELGSNAIGGGGGAGIPAESASASPPPPPPARPSASPLGLAAVAPDSQPSFAFDFTSFLLPGGSSGSGGHEGGRAPAPAATGNSVGASGSDGAFYRATISPARGPARPTRARDPARLTARDIGGDGGPEDEVNGVDGVDEGVDEGVDGGVDGQFSSGLDDTSDEEFYEQGSSGNSDSDSDSYDDEQHSGGEQEEEEGEEGEEEEGTEEEGVDDSAALEELWDNGSGGEEDEVEGEEEEAEGAGVAWLGFGNISAPNGPGHMLDGSFGGLAGTSLPVGSWLGDGPSSVSTTPLQGTSPAPLPGLFGFAAVLGSPEPSLGQQQREQLQQELGSSPSLVGAGASPMQPRPPPPPPALPPPPPAGAERLRMSLQLERQGLTDVEAQLLASWYHERASQLVTLSKLWLFENGIGDTGAAACASLFGPSLQEVHLSHNSMTNTGLAQLLSAVPTVRDKGLRPLWLRCEWNVLNLDQLEGIIAEQQSRGLSVHVPTVQGSSSHPTQGGHEMRLDRRAPDGTHVQLPWIGMQKQPPRESAVLRATRNAYRNNSNNSNNSGGNTSSVSGVGAWPRTSSFTLPTPVLDTSSSGVAPMEQPPAAARVPAVAAAARMSMTSIVEHPPQPPSPQPPLARAPPPPPPLLSVPDALMQLPLLSPVPGDAPPPWLAGAVLQEQQQQQATEQAQQAQQAHSTPPPPPPRAAPEASAARGGSGGDYDPGPLLLFPDTSAMLSMLGANTESGAPPLSLELMEALAGQGRFGRSLPADEQTFIVISDSVMKQLDGLKTVPECRKAIRRFFKDGLEAMGPAGFDFLTVLGAHEGEGLLLESGSAGAAGSSSPFISSKGQKVDFKASGRVGRRVTQWGTE
ncbi:hypothetical protein FOA52_014294 [Chlamydomonas sp. UWO 241]|nr:hypothetical protein FOA52_014294 [Chlamydomonas sp. UWO 241]